MPALPLSPTCETLFAETRRVLVRAIALPTGKVTLAAWTERLTAGSLAASASALAWSGSATPLPAPGSTPLSQAISASGEAITSPLGTTNRRRRRRGFGWRSVSADSIFMAGSSAGKTAVCGLDEGSVESDRQSSVRPSVCRSKPAFPRR